MLSLQFHSISEKQLGPKWTALYNTHWAAYKAWFISKGAQHNPGLKEAQAKLEKYMPEMLPTYTRMCELTGNDTLAARFLTGWRPPAFITGCSQAVFEKDAQLVRNYDYHPNLCEGTILHSAWNGKQVIATGDCLIGVVDGMNEDGLVVSLTFGGRKVVEEGFGIPFILRYVLEFCSTIDEAVAALKRIPSHMAYNIMVMDATGKNKMVEIAPDRAPLVTDRCVSTNHQAITDWPEHHRFSKTHEREDFLKKTLKEPGINAEKIADAFLNAPLFNTQYSDGFGTIYTAVYRPREKKMELRWLDQRSEWSFADFKEMKSVINFTKRSVAPVPAYQSTTEPIPAEYRDGKYWVQYGQAWASGERADLATYVAKSIVDAMGLGGNAAMEKVVSQFTSEATRRGQVPWEMLADLWSSTASVDPTAEPVERNMALPEKAS